MNPFTAPFVYLTRVEISLKTQNLGISVDDFKMICYNFVELFECCLKNGRS